MPLQMAKGANTPNGSASRPSTRALVAARSLIRSATSPELAATQEDVEDRADAPEEGDDDPQQLREPAQLLAVDDVDHAEDEGDRVQKDREHDLDDEFDHGVSVSRPRAAGWGCEASRRPASKSRLRPARRWLCFGPARPACPP